MTSASSIHNFPLWG